MNGGTELAAGRVRVSREDGIGWLVLDNPGRHNAISGGMWRTLTDAVASFAADPTVRCVVVRGEGDRAFCAGGDLAEKDGADASQLLAGNQLSLSALQALHALGKPTIAMVSGYCLGAGMALALACDLRVAADGATFGIPAAKLGLPYYHSEMKRLVDTVGPARAKQMVFTADRWTAQQALQAGLANEVVAGDQLATFVTAMAQRIASNAPLTIAAAKHAISTVLGDTAPNVAGCEAHAQACLASEDFVEGRRAFREKRPPVFRGC